MEIEKFARFLKQLRIEKQLTQMDVAKACMVTDKAVSKWERGISFPDLETISQLANILGVSISEMFSARRNNVHSSNLQRTDKLPDPDLTNRGTHLDIDFKQLHGVVSPLLFGGNFEHSRGAIMGGLSAELLRNRKFAGKPSRIGCALEWFPIGERVHFSSASPYTKHVEPGKMRRWNECNSQRIHNLYVNSTCGIGQSSICISGGERYTFEMVAKVAQDTRLKITLKNGATGEIYANADADIVRGDWVEYACTLVSDISDENACITLTFDVSGMVTIGTVSLMCEENFHGMRRDVIELLREIGVSVLRWPGGNFAGEYRWKDGLLPRNQRAPIQSFMEDETQPWSHGYDFHEINTDDFIALCREINAIPFITINPAWDSPEDCAQWVEYCNGDETTHYGRMRVKRGYREPYNVLMWSLGNEFGYGHMEGPNTPADYRTIVRKCADEMLAVTKNITFSSSGIYPDAAWFKDSALQLCDVAPIFAYHHYTQFMKSTDGDGDVNFADPVELKRAYAQMNLDVETVEREMEDMLPFMKDKLSICFDEWNVWYSWFRKIGVAEGIFAAKMLHMLMKRADSLRLFMACFYQPVNEGCIEVRAVDAVLTPLGQIFAAMKRHANGKLCFIDKYDHAVATSDNGVITVTLLNDFFDCSMSFNLENNGEILEARLYTSDSVLPYSKFNTLPLIIEARGSQYAIEVPAHSFAIIEMNAR